MSTAYSIVLRLPSRHMAKECHDWRLQPLPFFLIDKAENILHSGIASLVSLSDQLSKVKKIKLIVAASDVMLLDVAVPPLSAEKLKSALPALVESSIISDPATCHIVAGAEMHGLRRLAVIDRAWINTVINAVQKDGAKVSHIYPAQLCLPLHENSITASVMEMGDKADLSLRWPNNIALGIAVSQEKNSHNIEDDVVRILRLLMRQDHSRLIVPNDRVPAYGAAANSLIQDTDNIQHTEISKIQIIQEDNKSYLSEMKKSDVDLMAGLSMPNRENAGYSIWKLPLVLAASLLVLNIIALHIDWWRMRQESKQLYASLDHAYKKHFIESAKPDEQMVKLQEKLLNIKQKKGSHSVEDFISMLANTAIVWKKIIHENRNAPLNSAASNSGVIAAKTITKLNYSNAELNLSMKSAMAPDIEQAKPLLTENHLYLKSIEHTTPAQPDVVVWHLRARP